MLLLLCLLGFLEIFATGYGQLDTEQLQISSSHCYLTNITMDCGSDKIAIQNTVAGIKLLSSGCGPLDTDSHCCTHNATTDCTVTLDNDDRSEIQFCHGEIGACSREAINSITSECNSSYGQVSNYIFFTFYCIEHNRIHGIGGEDLKASVTNSIVYVVNNRFNNPGFSTQKDLYAYTVQTSDPASHIIIYTIVRTLDSGVNAVFTDADDNVLLLWTSDNNTYGIENTTLSSDSITVTFNVNGGSASTKFWLGFKGSETGSTITINYPPEVSQINTSNNSFPVYLMVVIPLSIAIIIGAAVGLYIYKRCHRGNIRPISDVSNAPSDLCKYPPADIMERFVQAISYQYTLQKFSFIENSKVFNNRFNDSDRVDAERHRKYSLQDISYYIKNEDCEARTIVRRRSIV